MHNLPGVTEMHVKDVMKYRHLSLPDDGKGEQKVLGPVVASVHEDVSTVTGRSQGDVLQPLWKEFGWMCHIFSIMLFASPFF